MVIVSLGRSLVGAVRGANSGDMRAPCEIRRASDDEDLQDEQARDNAHDDRARRVTPLRP
jgi:hypothetical protein